MIYKSYLIEQNINPFESEEKNSKGVDLELNEIVENFSEESDNS